MRGMRGRKYRRGAHHDAPHPPRFSSSGPLGAPSVAGGIAPSFRRLCAIGVMLSSLDRLPAMGLRGDVPDTGALGRAEFIVCGLMTPAIVFAIPLHQKGI